jgi:hypothetical protein
LEEKLLKYLPHIGLSTKAIGLVLVSNTLKKHEWSNSIFINSNVVEEIKN